MGIEALLNAGPPPEEPPGGSRLAELIARAAERPLRTVAVSVTVEDVTAEVVITEVRGVAWCELTSMTPPRFGDAGDAEVGYDRFGMLRAYPAANVTVDGEHPTAEQWAQLVDLLPAPAVTDIAAAIWVIHVHLPQQNMEAAKALAGEGSNG